MKTVVNKNSGIYYKGKYWNDLPEVLEYMSENFTGDKNKYWVEDFKERFAKKPFTHGLFLNCGNGRVEREFIDKKIVESATAFDYSEDLLKEAVKLKGKRNIKYFQADVNKIKLKDNEFDLIVNVAALHHVQFINRLCHYMARSLKKDGLLVNFDYIGPSRNQYPSKQWFYIKKVNNLLPEKIKQSLVYPHLPTMLKDDPTEVIHSDLIIESISHFFDIFEQHDTGGGIAYMLLTHNPSLKNVRLKELKKYVSLILKYDRKYTLENKVPPMFSYFIAKPNKEALLSKKRIKFLQEQENKREKKAERMGGVYTYNGYAKVKLHQIKNRVRFLKPLVRKIIGR